MIDRLFLERSGPLSGSVTASGSKNATLPILAACLLTEEPSVIEGIPGVTDVLAMGEILRRLGVLVEFHDDRVIVSPGKYLDAVAPYELVSRMRASICVLGPLLARQGSARVSMPGGCVIGLRPVDLHLKGLEALGASINIEHGYIVASARSLQGTRLNLSGVFGSSVLATANVMMAATLARGDTVIEHAAREPEVVALAECLRAMGACIEGHGTSVIRIAGVETLHGLKARMIPDRIEAGTFMIATAMLGGDVTIKGARPEHLGSVIEKLTEAGATIEPMDCGVAIKASPPLRAVHVTTEAFPGFPTDLQAPIVALMSISRGISVMTERVYPERFMHVSELARMGARISREGTSAVVTGVDGLSGAPVVASDLRAAAALVLAGLAAGNHTEVNGIEHLERGYERFEEKLLQLGARIRRKPPSEEALRAESSATPGGN